MVNTIYLCLGFISFLRQKDQLFGFIIGFVYLYFLGGLGCFLFVLFVRFFFLFFRGRVFSFLLCFCVFILFVLVCCIFFRFFVFGFLGGVGLLCIMRFSWVLHASTYLWNVLQRSIIYFYQAYVGFISDQKYHTIICKEYNVSS